MQNNRNLWFVGHWQNEAFSDVAILNVVVKCHAVESYALLIKVNGVFAPWNWKIDINESCQRLPCELSYLCFFNNLLVDQLGHTWLLVLLIFPIHLILFLFLLLFWLFDIESNFTHAVIVSYFLSCSLDDDIRFIDGRIVDFVIIDGQYLVCSVDWD